MYVGLLQKLKEASLVAALNSSNIRIVDKARVPMAPSAPEHSPQSGICADCWVLLAALPSRFAGVDGHDDSYAGTGRGSLCASFAGDDSTEKRVAETRFSEGDCASQEDVTGEGVGSVARKLHGAQVGNRRSISRPAHFDSAVKRGQATSHCCHYQPHSAGRQNDDQRQHRHCAGPAGKESVCWSKPTCAGRTFICPSHLARTLDCPTCSAEEPTQAQLRLPPGRRIFSWCRRARCLLSRRSC